MLRSLAGAAVIAVALAGASPASGAAPEARTGAAAKVTLEDISFKPATVRIRRGDRVTWTWLDGPSIPHDLRSTGSPRFKGRSAAKSGTHTVRFTRAGKYRYACTIHAGMTGTVVVR